jgi:hypothetical protein
MVRGRTQAPPGLVVGHEVTGEVIEAGRDVQFVSVADLVSVRHCDLLFVLPLLLPRPRQDLFPWLNNSFGSLKWGHRVRNSLPVLFQRLD